MAIIKDGRFPGSTAIQVGNKQIQDDGINEFNCENLRQGSTATTS